MNDTGGSEEAVKDHTGCLLEISSTALFVCGTCVERKALVEEIIKQLHKRVRFKVGDGIVKLIVRRQVMDFEKCAKYYIF